MDTFVLRCCPARGRCLPPLFQAAMEGGSCWHRNEGAIPVLLCDDNLLVLLSQRMLKMNCWVCSKGVTGMRAPTKNSTYYPNKKVDITYEWCILVCTISSPVLTAKTLIPATTLLTSYLLTSGVAETTSNGCTKAVKDLLYKVHHHRSEQQGLLQGRGTFQILEHLTHQWASRWGLHLQDALPWYSENFKNSESSFEVNSEKLGLLYKLSEKFEIKSEKKFKVKVRNLCLCAILVVRNLHIMKVRLSEKFTHEMKFRGEEFVNCPLIALISFILICLCS